MKRVWKRALRWALVLCWMGVIFFLSSQSAEESSALSDPFASVTGGLFGFLHGIFPNLALADWQTVVLVTRKAAHIFCYFALALTAFYALSAHTVSAKARFFYSLALCVLYAASDEWHQSFSPGRAMRATDVLIDTLGALAGLLLALWMAKLRQNVRRAKPPHSPAI